MEVRVPESMHGVASRTLTFTKGHTPVIALACIAMVEAKKMLDKNMKPLSFFKSLKYCLKFTLNRF